MRTLLLILIISLNSFSLSQVDSQLECSKCTVLISLRDSIPERDSRNGKIFYMPKENLLGTGFLVFDDVIGTNSVYLVTNKHIVIDDSSKKFYDQITLNLKSKVFSGKMLGLLSSPLPLVVERNGKIGAKKYNKLIDTNGYNLLWRDDTTSYSDLIVAKVFHYSFQFKEDGHDFLNKPYKLSRFIEYDSIQSGDDIFSYGFPGIIREYEDNQNEIFDFPTNYPFVLCPGRVIEKITKQKLVFKIGTFDCKNYLVLNIPALGGQSGSPIFVEKNGTIYLAAVFSGTFNDDGWTKGIGWPIDIVYRIIKRNKDYFINLN